MLRHVDRHQGGRNDPTLSARHVGAPRPYPEAGEPGAAAPVRLRFLHRNPGARNQTLRGPSEDRLQVLLLAEEGSAKREDWPSPAGEQRLTFASAAWLPSATQLSAGRLSCCRQWQGSDERSADRRQTPPSPCVPFPDSEPDRRRERRLAPGFPGEPVLGSSAADREERKAKRELRDKP